MTFLAQQLLIPQPPPANLFKEAGPATFLEEHYNKYSHLQGSRGTVLFVSNDAVPQSKSVSTATCPYIFPACSSSCCSD
jgi:hypothetical protein